MSLYVPNCVSVRMCLSLPVHVRACMGLRVSDHVSGCLIDIVQPLIGSFLSKDHFSCHTCPGFRL